MIYDSVIFDLDGTLWNAVDEIVDIWNIAIHKLWGVKGEITAEMLGRQMGKPIEEISRALLQGRNEEECKAAVDECTRLESEYLTKHGAKLYPGLRETLEKLKKRYPLFIVSNCQSGYIESFLAAHNMQSYFDGFLCPGMSGKLKADNIKALAKEFHLKNPVYVGDTETDRLACEQAGVDFIFASYGLGKAEKYDYKIDSLAELADLLL